MICCMHIAILILNLFICVSYSRAANILANSLSLQRLLEGSYYSKRGIYSRKCGIHFVGLKVGVTQ